MIDVAWTPRELNEWGALGGIVGRLAGDYWQVPALVGIDRVPGSDEMKHFGAALASYGSVALFHMVGITPEAQRLDDIVRGGMLALRSHEVGEADIRAFQQSYAAAIDTVDLVVFSAPQLSLVEMQQVAGLLDGRRASIPLLVVTSPQVKPDADRMGLTARIEARRRHRAFRHVLLPELRARNGGGEWLEAARDELGQAHQHHRRLRLPAGARCRWSACIDAACAGGRIAS